MENEIIKNFFKYIFVICIVIVMLGFYSVVFGAVALYGFGLSRYTSMVYVGLPSGLLISALVVRKIPKIFGLE